MRLNEAQQQKAHRKSPPHPRTMYSLTHTLTAQCSTLLLPAQAAVCHPRPTPQPQPCLHPCLPSWPLFVAVCAPFPVWPCSPPPPFHHKIAAAPPPSPFRASPPRARPSSSSSSSSFPL